MTSRLRVLKRLQKLMNAKRAAEEAKLARHQKSISVYQYQEKRAARERTHQLAELRNSDGVQWAYQGWSDFERNMSRERQLLIARARVSHSEQIGPTAKAVGAADVVDTLIKREAQEEQRSKQGQRHS